MAYLVLICLLIPLAGLTIGLLMAWTYEATERQKRNRGFDD